MHHHQHLTCIAKVAAAIGIDQSHDLQVVTSDVDEHVIVAVVVDDVGVRTRVVEEDVGCQVTTSLQLLSHCVNFNQSIRVVAGRRPDGEHVTTDFSPDSSDAVGRGRIAGHLPHVQVQCTDIHHQVFPYKPA